MSSDLKVVDVRCVLQVSIITTKWQKAGRNACLAPKQQEKGTSTHSKP